MLCPRYSVPLTQLPLWPLGCKKPLYFPVKFELISFDSSEKNGCDTSVVKTSPLISNCRTEIEFRNIIAMSDTPYHYPDKYVGKINVMQTSIMW